MMSLGLLVVALIAPTLAESTVLARGRFLEGAIALLVRALGLLGHAVPASVAACQHGPCAPCNPRLLLAVEESPRDVLESPARRGAAVGKSPYCRRHRWRWCPNVKIRCRKLSRH